MAAAVFVALQLAGLAWRGAAVDYPREAWDHPMTVVLVRSSAAECEPLCPEWLAAEGQITEASPAVFRKALLQVQGRKLPVVISSPGGHVAAALEIGRMLRKADLPVGIGWTQFTGPAPYGAARAPPPQGLYRGTVMIDGSFCASACPLVLAGGTERLVGEGSFIGLHVIRRQSYEERTTYQERERIVQGRRETERVATGRELVPTSYKDGIDADWRRWLRSYLAEMGVSDDFIAEMEKAGFNDLNHVRQQRLRDIHLVTRDDTILALAAPDICTASTPAANCRQLSQPLAAATITAQRIPAPPAAPASCMSGTPAPGCRQLPGESGIPMIAAQKVPASPAASLVAGLPATVATAVDVATPATRPPLPKVKPVAATVPERVAAKPAKPTKKSAKKPSRRGSASGGKGATIYGGL